MKLVKDVENVLLKEYSSIENIEYYIIKWHEREFDYENFTIYRENDNFYGAINIKRTLHNMDVEILLKIAIDLGIDTPDFIPSIPTFKNEIKSNYITAHSTFEKALKQIETDPSLAIGLANSALESIIKEILKDEVIQNQVKVKGTETLFDLTQKILKVFKLYPNSEMLEEIKTIGSSLLSINQSIEKLRSEKTNVHGKTTDEYIIQDPIYAYFIINNVTSIGLFLNSYYKKTFLKIELEKESNELPF